MLSSSNPAIQLIVGLGNPGSLYTETRHNAGVWFIESLCQHYKVVLQLSSSLKGRCAHVKAELLSFRIAVPTTFMNQSGLAVRLLARFYRIPLSNVLIIHDDLDLPAGVVRFKQNGGAGGHNGLKDIISVCNGMEFWRLRIGIGHPGTREQVHRYVLGVPSIVDLKKIQSAMQHAQTILPHFIRGNRQSAIQALHSEKF